MLQLGMREVVASGNPAVTYSWITISAYALQCLQTYHMQTRIVDAL